MIFEIKNNNALTLVIVFAILFSITTITKPIHAIDYLKSSQFINLGHPFLIEHYNTPVEDKLGHKNKNIS